MSRGTPWGETPVSKANTAEFDDGYARTFGADRKPVRGSWRFDAATGQMVEIGSDYTPPHAERVPVASDLYMDGVRAPDGTDIGSRAKRRAYMKAHGVADADDFKGTWKAAEARREREARGDFDHAARREAIGRALYEAQKGRR